MAFMTSQSLSSRIQVLSLDDLNIAGGDKILLGAGGSADIYWNLYAVHKEKHVLELLETMRIGKISNSRILIEGTLKEDKVVQATTDPFANEPIRNPSILFSSPFMMGLELLIRTQKPFNAETPPDAVSDKFYTPNEVFFVRNHLPVPFVDKDSYSLEISGEVFLKTTCSY